MLLAAVGSAQGEDVHLAGSAWVGDLPTRVAAEDDLFNRDLQPEEPRIVVTDHDSGLEALESLLAGQADYALAATTPTALALSGVLEAARDSERQVVVLASLALSNQSHVLITDTTRAIDEPGDLHGESVGVMRNTSSHFAWHQFARVHGLDLESIEIVDLPVSGMAGAMLDGEISAAMLWYPWQEAFRDRVGAERYRAFPLRSIFTLNWLLLAEREHALNRPDVVERVLNGYIDAMQVLEAERDATLRQLFDDDRFSPAEIRRMAESIIWRVGMNWSVLVNLHGQFDWLSRLGSPGEVDVPEPEEYLFGAPLKAVSPQRVTLPDYLMIDRESDVPSP